MMAQSVTFDALSRLFLIATVLQGASATSTGCRNDLPHTTAMKRHRDLCYQFVSEEKFWYDARKHCHQNGGRLAKVDNEETNAFLVRALNSLWWRNSGVWIGLHDLNREMQFQWTGYKPYENEAAGDWTNWGRGHPGAVFHSFRDCVRMVRGSGDWKWHETPCNSLQWHYRFICEYKVALDPVPAYSALVQDRPVVDNRVNDAHKPATIPQLPTTTELQVPQTVSVVVQDMTTEAIDPDLEEMNFETEDLEIFDFTTDMSIDFTENGGDYNNNGPDDVIPVIAESVQEVHADAKDVRFPFIIVFGSLIFSLLLIVIAFVFYRRRRKPKTVDDVSAEVSAEKLGKSEKAEREQRVTSAVANVYVIGDVGGASRPADDNGRIRFKHLPPVDVDSQTNDAIMTMTKEEEEVDCGMMGYDMPKKRNVYAEIPYDSVTMETDHVYESLDDVIAYADAVA